MRETQEFQERIGRIDGLVQKLDSAADPALRATARELVQALMDLHGGAIERILEVASKAGEAGAAIVKSLGRDELVSSLLVLYDLHPENFETRVQRGIEKARSRFASRGAGVDVLAIADSGVHLKIQASGQGCGSTARDLEAAVRQALYEVAPDAVEIVIEGVREPAAPGFVPLSKLQPANGSSAAAPYPGRP
jgi:hypothetical protein